MEHQGKLLHKLIKRKKLTQVQAADLLGFSREKLNRLFNKEALDEVTREDIEKIFELPANYFYPNPNEPEQNQTTRQKIEPSCWQMLAEARQEIIDLQKQLIEMSRPSINAPKGVKQTV